MNDYRTLEEDIKHCFEKRNIQVDEIKVSVRDGTYNIKVTYPERK